MSQQVLYRTAQVQGGVQYKHVYIYLYSGCTSFKLLSRTALTGAPSCCETPENILKRRFVIRRAYGSYSTCAGIAVFASVPVQLQFLMPLSWKYNGTGQFICIFNPCCIDAVHLKGGVLTHFSVWLLACQTP